MIAYITELTPENFDQFVESSVVMIDVYGTWCGPCTQISPIIDEIAAEFSSENKLVKVGKLDVDKNSEKVSEMNIRNIPAILIYKDGIEVDRIVGLSTKTKLKELVEKFL